jgi:hypothetical protein
MAIHFSSISTASMFSLWQHSTRTPVQLWAEVTFSYDPANGPELWRVRPPGWGWNAACRPIFEHGLVYVTTGQIQTLAGRATLRNR